MNHQKQVNDPHRTSFLFGGISWRAVHFRCSNGRNHKRSKTRKQVYALFSGGLFSTRRRTYSRPGRHKARITSKQNLLPSHQQLQKPWNSCARCRITLMLHLVQVANVSNIRRIIDVSAYYRRRSLLAYRLYFVYTDRPQQLNDKKESN